MKQAKERRCFSLDRTASTTSSVDANTKVANFVVDKHWHWCRNPCQTDCAPRSCQTHPSSSLSKSAHPWKPPRPRSTWRAFSSATFLVLMEAERAMKRTKRKYFWAPNASNATMPTRVAWVLHTVSKPTGTEMRGGHFKSPLGVLGDPTSLVKLPFALSNAATTAPLAFEWSPLEDVTDKMTSPSSLPTAQWPRFSSFIFDKARWWRPEGRLKRISSSAVYQGVDALPCQQFLQRVQQVFVLSNVFKDRHQAHFVAQIVRVDRARCEKNGSSLSNSKKHRQSSKNSRVSSQAVSRPTSQKKHVGFPSLPCQNHIPRIPGSPLLLFHNHLPNTFWGLLPVCFCIIFQTFWALPPDCFCDLSSRGSCAHCRQRVGTRLTAKFLNLPSAISSMCCAWTVPPHDLFMEKDDLLHNELSNSVLTNHNLVSCALLIHMWKYDLNYVDHLSFTVCSTPHSWICTNSLTSVFVFKNMLEQRWWLLRGEERKGEGERKERDQSELWHHETAQTRELHVKSDNESDNEEREKISFWNLPVSCTLSAHGQTISKQITTLSIDNHLRDHVRADLEGPAKLTPHRKNASQPNQILYVVLYKEPTSWRKPHSPVPQCVLLWPTPCLPFLSWIPVWLPSTLTDPAFVFCCQYRPRTLLHTRGNRPAIFQSLRLLDRTRIRTRNFSAQGVLKRQVLRERRRGYGTHGGSWHAAEGGTARKSNDHGIGPQGYRRLHGWLQPNTRRSNASNRVQ